MKFSSKAYWLIGVVATCYFFLTYFKRTPFPDFKQNYLKQNNASSQQGVELLPKTKPGEPIALVAKGEPQSPAIPDGFSGTELLSKLGSRLPVSSLEILQKSGDLPELQAAALEPEGKTYGIGIHSGGGLIVNLGKDNALLAFGFVSNADVATSDEEQRLLTEFTLSGQTTVTVLDEKFEAANMKIQTYQSKASPTKHALGYSQGRSGALVFFDSTRVEMKKLLPASPDTMDPAMLKQLRSLVEPAK